MKPTRINGNPVIVRARLPSNAHLDIPDDTDWEVISQHTDTTRGRRNAYDSALKTHKEYTRCRGNAAAHQVRIFYYGKEYTISEWEEPAGLWM